MLKIRQKGFLAHPTKRRHRSKYFVLLIPFVLLYKYIFRKTNGSVSNKFPSLKFRREFEFPKFEFANYKPLFERTTNPFETRSHRTTVIVRAIFVAKKASFSSNISRCWLAQLIGKFRKRHWHTAHENVTTFCAQLQFGRVFDASSNVILRIGLPDLGLDPRESVRTSFRKTNMGVGKHPIPATFAAQQQGHPRSHSR